MINSEKQFDEWLMKNVELTDLNSIKVLQACWNAAIELAKDICITYAEISECNYTENKLMCAAARHLARQIEGVRC